MSRLLRTHALEGEVAAARRELGPVDLSPHTAEDCPRMVRPGGSCDVDAPCGFVGCRWHLYGDVTGEGWLRVYRPALDPEQLGEHCAITVAMRGSHHYDLIGHLLGLTARQASEIGEAASAKYKAALLASLDGEQRAQLDIEHRRPYRHDPRLDDGMDPTLPEGYVPPSETLEETVGAHREIVRTSGEHIARRYRLPRLAERLYLMLISDAAWRRCGLSELTRAYAEQTGNAGARDKIAAALSDLEDAGLVLCEWRACGKVRRLRGVSLVSSLQSARSVTKGDVSDDCEEG